MEWGNERLDVVMVCRDELRHAVILAEIHETADRFLAAVCRWNTQPREEAIMVFDGHDWSPDHDLCAAIKHATFDSLILRSGLKEELLGDITAFFAARETYETYGVPWRRGILLLGPPDNGKTHAVKALVNAVERPCLYIRTLRSGHVPDEVNIERVFARARTSAPCILVLEDLDALITDKNRSYFLNELDGFDGNAGILTLATTNHPSGSTLPSSIAPAASTASTRSFCRDHRDGPRTWLPGMSGSNRISGSLLTACGRQPKPPMASPSPTSRSCCSPP